MRRTPSTKAIRLGAELGVGRTAAQTGVSTRMSTAAGSTSSASEPIWMDRSYSAAQGSRRILGGRFGMIGASLSRGPAATGPVRGRGALGG
jgi:hypothetical protein